MHPLRRECGPPSVVVEEDGEEGRFVPNVGETTGMKEIEALNEFDFSTEERYEGCEVLRHKAALS